MSTNPNRNPFNAMTAFEVELDETAFKDVAEAWTTKIYRRTGGRWSKAKCPKGRPIVFTLRKDKKRRLAGVVVSWRVEHQTDNIPNWKNTYGVNDGPAACIEFQLVGESDKL